jgi:hypothetical protein
MGVCVKRLATLLLAVVALSSTTNSASAAPGATASLESLLAAGYQVKAVSDNVLYLQGGQGVYMCPMANANVSQCWRLHSGRP